MFFQPGFFKNKIKKLKARKDKEAKKATLIHKNASKTDLKQ